MEYTGEAMNQDDATVSLDYDDVRHCDDVKRCDDVERYYDAVECHYDVGQTSFDDVAMGFDDDGVVAMDYDDDDAEIRFDDDEMENYASIQYKFRIMDVPVSTRRPAIAAEGSVARTRPTPHVRARFTITAGVLNSKNVSMQFEAIQRVHGRVSFVPVAELNVCEPSRLLRVVVKRPIRLKIYNGPSVALGLSKRTHRRRARCHAWQTLREDLLTC